MEKKTMTVVEKVESALADNKSLPATLLGRRAFERGRAARREMLALVYTDVREPIVWGHVLRHAHRWLAVMVGFETWFNAAGESRVFERYWHHLRHLGDWYPLDSEAGGGGEVYREADSFEGAVENLCAMIRAFHIDTVASEDSTVFLPDYRI